VHVVVVALLLRLPKALVDAMLLVYACTEMQDG
jgi:hypothetical protein